MLSVASRRKADFTNMAYTFNGIGTTFYGQRDFHSNGSFLTTEWVVFFHVPLIPFRSLRVRYQGPAERRFPIGFGSADSYAVYQKTVPNWKQVLCTYGYVASMIAWVYFIGSTAVSLSPRALDTVFSVSLVFIACIMPVPTPWILRYYAQRKLRA